jgi:hypothetical protein
MAERKSEAQAEPVVSQYTQDRRSHFLTSYLYDNFSSAEKPSKKAEFLRVDLKSGAAHPGDLNGTSQIGSNLFG